MGLARIVWPDENIDSRRKACFTIFECRKFFKFQFRYHDTLRAESHAPIFRRLQSLNLTFICLKKQADDPVRPWFVVLFDIDWRKMEKDHGINLKVVKIE